MDASSSNQNTADNSVEDSAVALLLHLNEERGKMFTESDYAEMRAAVLDELAHGARLRPFTLFTFGVIVLGLIGMVALGIVTARSNAVRDHLLTIVSTLALLAVLGFIWNLIRGLRAESERSLDARLAELDELQQRKLISPDEYQNIRANILIARQRAGAG
jgi:uncharacterized membrane protein YqjE